MEMVYEGKILWHPGNRKWNVVIWNNKQVPVLDIDVKGAIHVQQQYPDTTLSIFIEPPAEIEPGNAAWIKRHRNGRKSEWPR